MSPKPSPNDQRSDAKNPNNAAYEADRTNRQTQSEERAASPSSPAQTKVEPKKP